MLTMEPYRLQLETETHPGEIEAHSLDSKLDAMETHPWA
jgi:hypothetical protein